MPRRFSLRYIVAQCLATFFFLAAGDSMSIRPALGDAAPLTSAELWKSYVKNPNAHPNLPNCSYAGFACGEQPLPEADVTLNIQDFAAKADGKTDTSPAVEKAFLAAAAKSRAARADGGAGIVAIRFPAGTYAFSQPIRLTASGIILRGDGSGKTTLLFNDPLEKTFGPAMSGGKSRFSWLGGNIWIAPDAPQKSLTGWSEEWPAGPALATVKAAQKRGDFTVSVDNASAIKPDTLYLLSWTNPGDLSLLHHIAGHPSMEKYPWKTEGAQLVAMKKWQWPVLVTKVQGNVVTLKQPLRIDIRREWNVTLSPVAKLIQYSGVESLTLACPAHPAKPHLMDRGFNGIYFNKAYNCFARDIKLENFDNGIIHAAAKNTTVSGLTVAGGACHHATALRVSSHDNLIENFTIENKPHHGLNTEALSTGNVWRNSTMKDGTFDSHCAMSFESLRTRITINSTGSPGGASDAGPFLGARMAHWNIKMTGGKSEWINGPVYMPMGALVGIQNAPLFEGEKLWHMIPGDKGCIIADETAEPAIKDLYEAQLKLRLGK